MRTKIPQIAAAIIVFLLLVFAIVQYAARPVPVAQAPIATTIIDAAAAPTTTPTQKLATLSVEGTAYSGTVPASGLVLDFMKTLQSSGFAFTGKEYPSLGFFIDSINGKKAGDGYNWMLYVNDKQSDLGASMTKITVGDRIEWRYEK